LCVERRERERNRLRENSTFSTSNLILLSPFLNAFTPHNTIHSNEKMMMKKKKSQWDDDDGEDVARGEEERDSFSWLDGEEAFVSHCFLNVV